MTDNGKGIRLLGPVALDGGAGEPLSPRLRRVLTALVLGRGMQVSESSLIDIVWGDDGDLPVNPTRSLQTYISRLRSQLGPDAIERSGTGYRFVPDEVWVDITEFEHRLDQARMSRDQADDRSAIADLEHALSLWTGQALSDYSSESWAAAEAYRLEELRVDAEEQRAELLVGLDDVDGSLVADLERLALDHPHRDGPTRQLMLALHRSGRQADALAAFSRHRAQLATDLGLEPSDALALLESQILTDDPAVAKAARGRSLRGYDILERLGEGAFSIVYRGTQPSVGRDVAIKQIRAELANRPEFIRRFETEAHLVARLEHPHIVPLYDYWREPDSAYLVMRLLRGGNLEIALRSGAWDLERAIRMVGHIGGALAEAHRAGVVHRDVKPANILLDEIGNSYLTDFGIALEAHEATDTAGSLSAGSPAYASPEQLRREAASPAADVHGMGIVLYETLTGRLPFPDEPTQAALLQRQLHDPVPSLSDSRVDVPPGLDAVVAKATAKVPTDRYQSIEEFVEAVEEAVLDAVSEPVRRGVTTSIKSAERNPYKGLRAFDAADADDFAGRSRLVDQLAATSGTTDSSRSSGHRDPGRVRPFVPDFCPHCSAARWADPTIGSSRRCSPGLRHSRSWRPRCCASQQNARPIFWASSVTTAAAFPVVSGTPRRRTTPRCSW
ncbi:MAG: protein kinase [Acidimicrobiia bacterium]|nr:protein kinase [Acidimicrobiia bacterium]